MALAVCSATAAPREAADQAGSGRERLRISLSDCDRTEDCLIAGPLARRGKARSGGVQRFSRRPEVIGGRHDAPIPRSTATSRRYLARLSDHARTSSRCCCSLSASPSIGRGRGLILGRGNASLRIAIIVSSSAMMVRDPVPGSAPGAGFCFSGPRCSRRDFPGRFRDAPSDFGKQDTANEVPHCDPSEIRGSIHKCSLRLCDPRGHHDGPPAIDRSHSSFSIRLHGLSAWIKR